LGVTWFFETAWQNAALGTWAHIAVTRSDTILRFWLDGALVGVRGLPAALQVASTTGPLDVGTLYSASSVTNSYFTGYIDDVRITKGVARYTANFTPPALPFCPL
jgi:hypothetical protein